MRLKVWEPHRRFRPFYNNIDRFVNEFGWGLQPAEGLDDALPGYRRWISMKLRIVMY